MTCSQQGCTLGAALSGMCRRHYNFKWRMENPNYARNRQWPCIRCEIPCRSQSYCHVCLQAMRRRKVRKMKGWQTQQLEYSAYYRREWNDSIVMRVYAGYDYRYEVESGRHVIFKKVATLSRAMRGAEFAAKRIQKMGRLDAKR